MGGYHPEQPHGHLVCCLLSNHALTGALRPKIRIPGKAHTSLNRCCFFRCPSKYNCHLEASSLDSRYSTFAQIAPTLVSVGAPCPRLSLSLPMFVHHRSPPLETRVAATHCTTWNPRSRLTHDRRRHHLCHHYSHPAASP